MKEPLKVLVESGLFARGPPGALLRRGGLLKLCHQMLGLPASPPPPLILGQEIEETCERKDSDTKHS